MHDDDCLRFLQNLLPELGYRWNGFRKVRKQVCKRIRKRVRELDLPDLSSYHQYLGSHRGEFRVLDSLCNITISRFYRDRHVFGTLTSEILPLLAEKANLNQRKQVRCWSAGCCSGEEPFTLQGPRIGGGDGCLTAFLFERGRDARRFGTDPDNQQ